MRRLKDTFSCTISFITLEIHEKNEFANISHMPHDTRSIYHCAVNIQRFLTYASSDDVRRKGDA